MQAKPTKTQSPTPAAKPASKPVKTNHPTPPAPAAKKAGVVRKTLQSNSVRRHPLASATILISICLLALAGVESAANTHSRAVVVSSIAIDTDNGPACGGDLIPGDKAVAVSPDLFKSGIKCGVMVWIGNEQYQVRHVLPKSVSNRVATYSTTPSKTKQRISIQWRA